MNGMPEVSGRRSVNTRRWTVGLLLLCLLLLAGNAMGWERVTYIHTDALGSVVAATDEDGNILWREGYQPYGKRLREEAGSNRPWYTGKYEEDVGLLYYGKRWYNPEIGRFYSVDPVRFDENNLHSFNRYAYANNNPYKFVDPDGEEPLFLAVFRKGTTIDQAMERSEPFRRSLEVTGTLIYGVGAAVDSGSDVLFPLKGGAKSLAKKAIKRGLGKGRNTSRSFDTGGPTTSRPSSFPQGNSQTQHIFRDAPGHLPDTPANRNLLQGVANDSRTTLGTDRFGNTWSARTQSDGSQVWVQTRNGVIQNGGVNATPRTFNPQTGLSGR